MVQNVLMQRLPCVKGDSPQCGEMSAQQTKGLARSVSAKLTEGLFCVDYRFLQSLRHGKPCHLPLHKGGFFACHKSACFGGRPCFGEGIFL